MKQEHNENAIQNIKEKHHKKIEVEIPLIVQKGNC